MRYECGDCAEIIDEGDLVRDYYTDEDGMTLPGDLCPACGSNNLTKLDESEYGN